MHNIRLNVIAVAAMCFLISCSSQVKKYSVPRTMNEGPLTEQAKQTTDSSALKCSLPDRPCLEIHTINVGQGNSSLVKLPSGKFILIDAGGSSAGKERLTKVINNVVKTGNIQTIVLSGSDTDHAGWIKTIPQAQNPVSIHISGIVGNYARNRSKSTAYDYLSQYADDSCNKKPEATATVYCYPANYHTPEIQSCEPGSQFGSKYACIGIFAVNWKKIDADNPQSLVLAIYLQGQRSYFRAIFPGDITNGAQNFMANNLPEAWLNSTVYLFAHHGADTHGSNNIDWLQKVRAQVYIASAKNHGTCKHLRYSVVQAMSNNSRINSSVASFCGNHNLTLGNPPHPATTNFCNIQLNQCVLSTFNSGHITTVTDGANFTVTPEYPSGLPHGLPNCPAL